MNIVDPPAFPDVGGNMRPVPVEVKDVGFSIIRPTFEDDFLGYFQTAQILFRVLHAGGISRGVTRSQSGGIAHSSRLSPLAPENE